MTKDRARAAITRRLLPGEKLIWYDTPTPWRAAFSPLVFLGFATLWLALVVRIGEPKNTGEIAQFVPTLFLLVGGGMWLWAAWEVLNCWRTAYGVTDRRAIIAVGDTGRTLSFTANAMGNIAVTGNGDFGTVKFDYGPTGRSESYRHGFYGIAEPRRVEAAIHEYILAK